MAEDRLNPLNNPAVANGMNRSAREEDWQPPDDQFDDFINQLSGLEQDTEPEPPVVTEDPAAPVAQPPAQPPSAPAVPPVLPPTPAPASDAPQVARFSYNGKYYTVDELAREGLLAEALQKATQYDTVQQQPPQRPQQPTEPAQPQQQYQAPSAQDVQRYYAPVVQEMVRQGHVEEDLAALYPSAVSGMFQMRDMIMNMARKVVEQDQYIAMLRQREMRDNTVNHLYTAMDTAAEADQIYAGLRDQAERKQFEDYLRSLNLEVDKINPDLIQQQWFAFKGPQIFQQLRQAGTLPQGAAPAASPPAPAPAPPRASGRLGRQPAESVEEWGDLLPWN